MVRYNTDDFWGDWDEDSLYDSNKDVICRMEPPLPNGEFYRDDPVYVFSPETLQKTHAAFGRIMQSAK